MRVHPSSWTVGERYFGIEIVLRTLVHDTGATACAIVSSQGLPVAYAGRGPAPRDALWAAAALHTPEDLLGSGAAMGDLEGRHLAIVPLDGGGALAILLPGPRPRAFFAAAVSAIRNLAVLFRSAPSG